MYDSKFTSVLFYPLRIVAKTHFLNNEYFRKYEACHVWQEATTTALVSLNDSCNSLL